jgi:hypothetical protein
MQMQHPAPALTRSLFESIQAPIAELGNFGLGIDLEVT